MIAFRSGKTWRGLRFTGFNYANQAIFLVRSETHHCAFKFDRLCGPNAFPEATSCAPIRNVSPQPVGDPIYAVAAMSDDAIYGKPTRDDNGAPIVPPRAEPRRIIPIINQVDAIRAHMRRLGLDGETPQTAPPVTSEREPPPSEMKVGGINWRVEWKE
jgi:hypothetical protein